MIVCMSDGLEFPYKDLQYYAHMREHKRANRVRKVKKIPVIKLEE